MIADLLFGAGAIVLGIAGSLVLFWLLDRLINLLPASKRANLRYLAFLGPAAALIVLVLLYPLIQTFFYSFMDERSKEWVGLANYQELFGDPEFWGILLNNFLWVAFVPAFTVGIGLLVAQL
ncbi:MAG: sugar ABC transporter permease, partial [Aquiluna sp.]